MKMPDATPISKPVGSTGLYAPGGIIRPRDENPELQVQSVRYGTQTQLGSFERGYRTDGTVKSVVQAIILPVVQSAERGEIEPNGADPRVVAYVRWLLFEQGASLSSWLRGAFRTALVNGFSLSETIAYLEPTRRWYGIAKVSPRPPWTIWRWDVTPEGDWLGVVQMLTGGMSGSMPYIPRTRLLHWVIDRDGDDPTGESILRAVHREISTRAYNRKMLPVYIERSIGVPTVQYPTGTSEASKEAIRAALRGLRNHESSYLMINKDSSVTWFAPPQGTGESVLDITKGLGEQIRESLGQEVRSLGTSATGSRAVGEVLESQFMSALRAYSDMALEPINYQLIPRFVDWTFGKQARYHFLKAGAMRPEDAKPLIEATTKPDAAPAQVSASSVSLAAPRKPKRTPPRQRIWSSHMDDLTCKVCRKLDGKRSRSGLWRVDGLTLDGPPAHPDCRCSATVELSDVLAERGGMAVQSLIFDRRKFDAETTRRWSQKNGYASKKIDIYENFVRVRQKRLSLFDPGTERTIEFRPNIKAIVGRLKEKK